MGKRSRKRRPDGEPLAPTTVVDPTEPTRPATSEAPEAPDETPTPAADAGAGAASDDDAPELTRAERTELRYQEIRSTLEPLGDGERPGAVTVAAVVALLLAISNLVLWALGTDVRGSSASPVGVIVFAALMLFAAWGMWRAKYWAVLGFQALLAVTVIIAFLSLMVAARWQAVVICLVIIGFGGWLFWKLIRAMARIQMPRYER
jgi:hypothetical protein